MQVRRSAVTGLVLLSLLLPVTGQAQIAGSRAVRETIRLNFQTNLTPPDEVRAIAISICERTCTVVDSDGPGVRSVSIELNYTITNEGIKTPDGQPKYLHTADASLQWGGLIYNGQAWHVSLSSSTNKLELSIVGMALEMAFQQMRRVNPITSRITGLDGDRASVDMGSNVGMFKGARLVARSTEGRELGLIKIDAVRENTSEGRVLRGRDRMQEGDQVTRCPPFWAALLLEANRFPVRAAANPLLRPGRPWRDIQAGQVRLTARCISKRWSQQAGSAGLQVATGITTAEKTRFEAIAVQGFAAQEILPEKLVLEVAAGLGFGQVPSERWARPSEPNSDGLPESGTTRVGGCTMLNAVGRLHILKGRNGFFIQAGYRDIYDDPLKDKATKKRIDEQWIEERLDSRGGFSLGIGISRWYGR
jgi:hypothetical protein